METLAGILSSLGFQEYGIIALALSIFIDINPKIKFNPIKAIIRYLGKWFNSSVQKEIAGFKLEVNQKFKDLQDEQVAQRETLNKLVADMELKEISKLRWEIIDFETSILNKEKHSREQYRHILDSTRKFLRSVENQNDFYNIPEEDIAKIKEAETYIKNHYEENRMDQSKIFF